MGQFKDTSIKDIIEELNQSYFLPDIQREYVWLRKAKEKKIEQLFDSILRGYPIGSFLFWKLKKDDIETNKNAKEDSKKLNFQLYKFIENYDVRKPHNVKINIEQINSDDLSIVLDGQQRLTSLYIGLKGTRTLKIPRERWADPNAFEEKQLFINLRYQPKEESPDDNFDFNFLRKKTISKTDDKHYWFKVGEILELESVFSYATDNGLSHSEAKILEKLKNAFCITNLISYFEEGEKNLDKVLKIFIRVNSGGTKLEYSDLLMSILTANFSTDIRDLMNRFVDSLRDQGFEKMGRDQVLKTCLMLTESNHKFQLKNFSKSNINKIEKNWEEITDAIFKACELLKEFGYSNRLSSAYILSIVAYYIFKKKTLTLTLNQEDKNEKNKNELLKFVRNAQITSYFTTSLDDKLEVVAKIIRNADHFESVNNKLTFSKMHPLKISSDDIDRMVDLEYGHPAILPILQILYPNLDYKNSTFHIDHIYPKSKFKKETKQLAEEYLPKADFLYNLQLLPGDKNMEKKDKDPAKWLKISFFLKGKEKIKAYKNENYIKESHSLSWKEIKKFDEYRSDKIKSKLREILLTEKKMPVANQVDTQ